MAQQQKLKKSDEQLHWFWRLTTKWWFFIALYLFLVILLSFYISIKYNASAFLGVILVMPLGIFYWFGLLDNPSSANPIFIILVYVVMAFSSATIYYLKFKRGIILKWLIIILILLMVGSFGGCVAYLQNQGYLIGA